MTEYLKQIIGEDIEELYAFPTDVESGIVRVAYISWMDHPEFEGGFEDWWNEHNPSMHVERIFVDEIFV